METRKDLALKEQRIDGDPDGKSIGYAFYVRASNHGLYLAHFRDLQERLGLTPSQLKWRVFFWGSIWIAAFIFFLVVLFDYILFYAKSETTYAQLFLAARGSVEAGIIMFVSPFLMRLSDRTGRKGVLLCAQVCGCIGFAMYAVIPGYYTFWIASLFTGFAYVGFPMNNAILRDIYDSPTFQASNGYGFTGVLAEEMAVFAVVVVTFGIISVGLLVIFGNEFSELCRCPESLYNPNGSGAVPAFPCGSGGCVFPGIE